LLRESRRRGFEADAQLAVATRKLGAQQAGLAGERHVRAAFGRDPDALRLVGEHMQRRERRMPAETDFAKRGEPAKVERRTRLERRERERRLRVFQLFRDALELVRVEVFRV